MSWFRGSSLAAVSGVAAAVATLAMSASADAHVKHEGTWPDQDKVVSLDVNAPRTEALRKLADVAGWSLVVHAPAGDPVDIHVKQQPASKVLDLLLKDGDYVATRDGTLVSIEREAASAATAPPPLPPPVPHPAGSAEADESDDSDESPSDSASAAPPGPSAKDLKIQIGSGGSEVDEPHARGQDRTVMGGNVTIAKGEVARDVTVFGGNVEIEGNTTGDVTVFGGNVRVHTGAKVHGDATVFGGTLTLDPGAKVDGDVSAIGGTLKRDPASQVKGDVTVKDSDSSSHHHDPGLIARAGESVMDGLRLAAVLFVIGTVLLALAGRRMDTLRTEVAARPMRSIALGLLGSLCGVLVLVALCVTVIGIPVAAVAAILGGFGLLGAMCAVLSVVGEGLLRHKTENPYVHLGVGCALFVALAAIPWIGGFVVAATVLAGIGVLVATRGAGLFQKRNGGPSSYRPASPVA